MIILLKRLDPLSRIPRLRHLPLLYLARACPAMSSSHHVCVVRIPVAAILE